MRTILAFVAFSVAASPCLATTPCVPPRTENVIITYTGAMSGCSFIGGTYCQIGELVTFEARSFAATFCPATTFEWNFGDGSAAATGAAVSHAYSSGGLYEVQLAVKSPDAPVLRVQTSVVFAIVDPPPPILYERLAAPRAYRFRTYMTDGPWKWDFGDGTVAESTGSLVDHQYARGGRYVINLYSYGTGRRYMAAVEVPVDKARSVRH